MNRKTFIKNSGLIASGILFFKIKPVITENLIHTALFPAFYWDKKYKRVSLKENKNTEVKLVQCYKLKIENGMQDFLKKNRRKNIVFFNNRETGERETFINIYDYPAIKEYKISFVRAWIDN